jgi:ankyrin repeat protein
MAVTWIFAQLAASLLCILPSKTTGARCSHRPLQLPGDAVIRVRREAVVRLLLQSEVDVNACSSRGITPLHVAAKEGHFRLLQLLIYANAHVNAQSLNGITALVCLSCMLPLLDRTPHPAPQPCVPCST